MTVILTDPEDLDVIDMQERMRAAFPYLLEIRRDNLRKADYGRELLPEEMTDPFALCCAFLKELDDGTGNFKRCDTYGLGGEVV